MRLIFKLGLIALLIQSCSLHDESACYWDYDGGRYYTYQGELQLDSKTRNMLKNDSTSYIHNTTDMVIKVVDIQGRLLSYSFKGKAKNIRDAEKKIKRCLKGMNKRK